MNVVEVALYFLFIHITLLVPGYALVKKTKLLAKHPGLELSFAYLTTIVIFASLATASYAFKLSPELTRIACWLFIIYGLVEFIRLRYYKSLAKLYFPLACLLVMSLLASLFLSLTYGPKYTNVPDPTPQPTANYKTLNVKVLNISQTRANDNYIPYRQAQFFVNRSDPNKDSFIREWGVNFFVRTPLMGAVTANYFNLLDDKPPISYTWSATGADPSNTYQKFQILAHVLNYLFIIPAFYLLKKIFNRKVALITSLFLVTSQFFLYNAVFSWPKSLVAFFILTSWMLLLEKKPSYTLLAGVVSGLAYLTHDLAVLYIGASLVFLLINKRFRELLFFTIPAILLAIPWYIASNIIYHNPSNFIYYPISTGGIPQLQHKKEIISQFFHTSPLTLLKIRVGNLLYLLSPYELFTSEGGQAGFRRIWALGLFSIPGALGLGLLVPAYLAVLKRIRTSLVWVFIFLPVLFSTIVIGWPKGLGALHFAEPIVVLASGLAISLLVGLKSARWLITAYILNVAQLIFFIAYSFSFATRVWFTNVGDIIRIVLMLGLIVLVGWLILRIARNNKILQEV